MEEETAKIYYCSSCKERLRRSFSGNYLFCDTEKYPACKRIKISLRSDDVFIDSRLRVAYLNKEKSYCLDDSLYDRVVNNSVLSRDAIKEQTSQIPRPSYLRTRVLLKGEKIPLEDKTKAVFRVLENLYKRGVRTSLSYSLEELISRYALNEEPKLRECILPKVTCVDDGSNNPNKHSDNLVIKKLKEDLGENEALLSNYLFGLTVGDLISLLKDEVSVETNYLLGVKINILLIGESGVANEAVILDENESLTDLDKDIISNLLYRVDIRTVFLSKSDLNNESQKYQRVLQLASREKMFIGKISDKDLVFNIVYKYQVSLIEAILAGKLNRLKNKVYLKTPINTFKDPEENLECDDLKKALKILEELKPLLVDDLNQAILHLFNLYGLGVNEAINLEIADKENADLIISFDLPSNILEDNMALIMPLTLFSNVVLERTDESIKTRRLKHVDTKDLEYFLKFLFGYDQFRPYQEEGIKRLLAGRRTVMLLPTGSGKSIVYQLSSLLLPKTSIIVAPIVSLIDDQEFNLRRNGIDLFLGLNSQLDAKKKMEAMLRLKGGNLSGIIVSPEKLLQIDFYESLLDLDRKNGLSIVAIDEVHCVSEWGHDFRPSYIGAIRILKNLIMPGNYRKRPLGYIGLTGTASPRVLKSVLSDLGINEDDALILPKNFDRPEIKYHVEISSDFREKGERLKDYITDFMPCYFGKSSPTEFYLRDGIGNGLVFSTKVNGGFGVVHLRDLISMTGLFKSVGVYSASEPYNYRVDPAKTLTWNDIKVRTMYRLRSGYYKVLVCTKAFGMGVDKSDIRFTIHSALPASIEEYYQEAGRAGRDRQDAASIVLPTVSQPDIIDELLSMGTSLNKIKSFLSDKKRPKIGDLETVLYFHVSGYKDKDMDLKVLELILKDVELFLDKKVEKTLIVRSGQKFMVETALSRLIQIGALDYYLVKGTKYRLFFNRVSDRHLINSYFRLITNFRAVFVSKRVGKLKEALKYSNNANKKVETAFKYLLNFEYNIIEKSKRQAIRSCYELFNEANKIKNAKEQDRFIRSYINSYLDMPHKGLLKDILDSEDELKAYIEKISSEEFKEILNNKQLVYQLWAEVNHVLLDAPDSLAMYLLNNLSLFARGKKVNVDVFSSTVKELSGEYKDKATIYEALAKTANILSYLTNETDSIKFIDNLMQDFLS